VTTLPYLYGYLVAGVDRVFMGIVMNVPDTAQYFSWARESQRAILIENKLTPESGDAVYFNLFWLVIGRLASWFSLSISVTTQIARLVVGAAYIVAIYWFLRLVTRSTLERWSAVLVAVLGGGLGWLLVVGKQLSGTLAAPLDLYITEPNTWLTVMAFPHQAIAGAFQVVILGMAALAFERASVRLALIAGVLGLLLGVQHGYDLLIVYAVVGTVGALLVLRDHSWRRTIGLGVLICAPSMPAALYLAYLTRVSPIWRGVLAQYGNAGVFTPSLPNLFVLMGVPLILAAAGLPWAVVHRTQVRAWFERASAREILVWAWLVVGLALLYIPTDFQVKMLACWQVPVAFAATRVLLAPGARMLQSRGMRHPHLPHVLVIAFVLSVIPVSLYLVSWRIFDLGRRDYPYFLKPDEVAATHWLDTHASRSDVVLSSLTIGQYVPELTGDRAFLAHWAETLDFYGKRGLVNEFFDAGTSDTARQAILQSWDVQYVLYSEEEHALGAYDPERSPYLTPVFSSPGATVYRTQVATAGARDAVS
jgi:hypothetical protein